MLNYKNQFSIVPHLNKICCTTYQFFNYDQVLNNTAYMLFEDDQVLIIDPNFLGEHLIQFCQEHKLKIVGILLTHGHWDHWVYARKLIEFAQVPIYCHIKDQPIVAVGLKRIHELMPNYDPQNLIDDLIVYCDWKDLEIIEIGPFKLEVLTTPGHSPGSVCFLWDNKVFSGDHVFANSIGHTKFYLSDPEAMWKSLDKFVKHYNPCNLVLPGHLDHVVRVRDTYQFIEKILAQAKTNA